MIDSFRHTVEPYGWKRPCRGMSIYLRLRIFRHSAVRCNRSGRDFTLYRAGPKWIARECAAVAHAGIESEYGPIQVFADEQTIAIGVDRIYLQKAVLLQKISGLPCRRGRYPDFRTAGAPVRLYSSRNSSLQLYTARWRGAISLSIGVYYDYASSQGNLLMSMDLYSGSIWQDDAVTAISLSLAPEADADAAGAGIERCIIQPTAPAGETERQALRADVLEIFDRTFAITGALRILATLVACNRYLEYPAAASNREAA
jgi:hypothetical protein